jgi:hypothetical protein
VTICPCCGFRFEGDLRKGCPSCGSRSVGEPLPKPERELPAYGRSLLLVVTGSLMVLALSVETIIAFVERGGSLSFWSWVAAGETAAWRLKFIALPVLFAVIWTGRRIYQSMLKAPARFVGMDMARRGLMASALVALIFATLIGVTVPARLRQREMADQAEFKGHLYTVARAQLDYSALHGMVASDISDLKTLPDPDGSIAEALADLDQSTYRTQGPDVAVVKPKQRTLPGAVLRNASVSSAIEDPPVGGLSTNYELRLPGEDKILDTDDDVILRDGVIMTVARTKETSKPAAATARARKK